MARVVLGVAGGIAAYKSCEVVRRLRGSGHEVRVVPTRASLEFVGAATWAALSGQPVHTDVWSDVHEVPHVRIGQEADLVLVAPATADVLAKAAHGLADDLLGNVLLTARCPVVFAPAMHTEMWQHPATVANVELLRTRGAMVLDPAVGRLTGADSGPGRLPEAHELATTAVAVLEAGGVPARDLVGRRVVVSAGGTREALDPVRFLGNRSSGKQGYALAAAARDRGAQVTLVAANCQLPDPSGVEVVAVRSARELQTAVAAAVAGADVVVMAAAVADYRPARVADAKLKKARGGVGAIELTENPDVLAGLVADRGESARPLLVGFAAETGDDAGDALDHARRKLVSKGCDVLVVNEVGDGRAFEVDDNAVTVLLRAPAGSEVVPDEVAVPPGSKRHVADAVWDIVGRVGGWA